jgi:hypothetical protein
MKNTIFNVEFFDAEALCQTINQQKPFGFIGAGFIAKHNKKGKLIKMELFINYERYAMNGAGFHVGYEQVEFTLNCIKKSSLDILSFPHILSSYVIMPSQVTIQYKSMPEEDKPLNTDHEKDCPNYKRKNSNKWEYCD